MITLNLINKEKSDIPYEIFHFPDGEVQIDLESINHREKIKVICRITNAEELFILMQVGDILNRQGVEWSLEIWYLMSMRMDRVIDFNRPFSLSIVANIIKQLNPSNISVVHPHSSRTLSLLGAESALDNPILYGNKYFGLKCIQYLFPDEGAYNRYYTLFNSYYHISVGKRQPLIGEKVRDASTGKIESIIIKNPECYLESCITMVVDDLCDAGGTFLGIAKAVREINKNANLLINIVHMVNRKGIENLSSTYDTVFFTNSYKDWDNLPNNCIMYDLNKIIK